MQGVWKSQAEGIAIDDSLAGFIVVDRGGEKVGRIDGVNYAGTCLKVASGGLLKKKRNLVPAAAIKAVDLEAELVEFVVTAAQIEEGPEYDEVAGIDEECEGRVEQYYTGLLGR